MEKITLIIFLACMVACASCFITGIWFEDRLPDTVFKIAATFFVIGLANFLVWFTHIAYRFVSNRPSA